MLDYETVEECVRSVIQEPVLLVSKIASIVVQALGAFSRSDLESSVNRDALVTTLRDFISTACREHGEECDDEAVNEIVNCILSRAVCRGVGRFKFDNSTTTQRILSVLCSSEVEKCLRDIESEIENGTLSLDQVCTILLVSILNVFSSEGAYIDVDLDIDERYVTKSGRAVITSGGISIEFMSDRAIFKLSREGTSTYGKVQVDSYRHGGKTSKSSIRTTATAEHAGTASEDSSEVEEW